MRALVHRSRIKGKARAPSSKSYTIRGLMCAALARGESEITSPLSSDDTDAATNVLSRVGVSIKRKNDSWRVTGGDFHEPDTDLFCGESAATLRFMTAICSLVPGKCRLTAGGSLLVRPVKPLVEALRQLGVSCFSQDDCAPVTVGGGRLRGGIARLPGDISSQFVSALLFVAPLAENDVEIGLTTPLESKPFVLMTLDCLEKFGIRVKHSKDLRQFEISKQTYNPTSYRVEGDWSSASYFLALGAMSGEVEVENLNPESLQGDKIILDFLRDMGALVDIKEDSITVRRARLSAIKADLSDCIDLLPTMSVLAAVAEGTSQFAGIERARIKESDRVLVVKQGLERMGVRVKEDRDRITIYGSRPQGATIDSRGDHRIAMAFSLLGLVAGGTVIEDAECVSKTFPQFWDVLKSIGGEVGIDGE